MADVKDEVAAKADEAQKAANAAVQEKGPGVVLFIQNYWYYGAALIALLALLHFGFGVNL
jgi:hypothetical protein